MAQRHVTAITSPNCAKSALSLLSKKAIGSGRCETHSVRSCGSTSTAGISGPAARAEASHAHRLRVCV